MQNVTFDEDSIPNHIFDQKNSPGIAEFLISNKIVKNVNQARFLFLLIIAICIGTSIWMFASNNTTSKFITLPDGQKIAVTEYIEGVKLGIYK